MPGLFTIAAGGLAAQQEGQHFADEQSERDQERKRKQQDDAIQRAAVLATLSNQGIVTGANRANLPNDVPGLKGTMSPVDVPGTANTTGQHIVTPLVLPKTQNLTTAPQVDTDRYAALGDTGMYQDRSKTSDAILARQLAKQEQITQRKMAAVRATHPELKNASDDQVRGIAEDEKSYSEYMKPAEEHFAPVPAGDTNVYSERTGKVMPTGQPAKPIAPVLGTPEYESAEARLARIRAAARRGSATGNDPITPDDRTRVALNERLSGLSRQMSAADKAIKDAQSADDADTPTGNARIFAAQHRADSLRKVSDGVNQQLGDVVNRRVAGQATARAGLTLASTLPSAPDAVLLKLDKQFSGDTNKIKTELRRLGFRDDQ